MLFDNVQFASTVGASSHGGAVYSTSETNTRLTFRSVNVDNVAASHVCVTKLLIAIEYHVFLLFVRLFVVCLFVCLVFFLFFSFFLFFLYIIV